VKVIFHPLVKVIIYPNLLFLYVVAPATWQSNARYDPGRDALGSGIKLPYEYSGALVNSERFSRKFMNEGYRPQRTIAGVFLSHPKVQTFAVPRIK
jgi:hypothetical protein